EADAHLYAVGVALAIIIGIRELDLWRSLLGIHQLQEYSGLRDSEDSQDERVVEGGLFQALIAAGRAEMTAAEIGFEQQEMAIGFGRTEFRGPLGGLPIRDTGVIQTSGYENVRICP